MEPQITCSHCKNTVSVLDNFCPHCGSKIKEKQISTTLVTQVLIYVFSIFLAPLGLWPAIKYLRQPDAKAKRIGMTALVLTLISVLIISVLAMRLVSSYGSIYTQQLDIYKDLGL
jgi:DNA-directed RNA polymerase subunit RPC12/RpoP